MKYIEEKIQELEELVGKTEFVDAYDKAYSYYLETKNSIFLLFRIGLQIDYIQEEDPNKVLNDLLSLHNLPKRVEPIHAFRIVQIALITNNNKLLIEYAKKIIDLGNANSFIYSVYAKAVYDGKKDTAEANKYIDMVINDLEVEDEMLSNAVLLKLQILLDSKQKDKADDLLIKVIHRYSNKEYYHLNALYFDLFCEGKEADIDDRLTHIISKDLKQLAYEIITSKMQSDSNHLGNIKYSLQMKELIDKEAMLEEIDFNLAVSYVETEEIEKAFAIFDDYIDNDKNKARGFFYYAKYYKQQRNYDGYRKAIDYYLKANEHLHDPSIYMEISELYIMMYDPKGLSETIEKINTMSRRFRISISPYIYYLEGEEKAFKNDFDGAQKLITKAYAQGFMNVEYYNIKMIEYAKNPKPYQKYFLKNHILTQDPLDYEYEMRANAYLYGLFGLPIDLKKAKDIILKAIESNDNCACYKTILGRIYLEENNPLAFNEFQKAVALFEEKKDDCPCGYAYLAYCYIKGIGVDIDIEKAKEIVISAIEKNTYDPNTMLLFAYLAYQDGGFENGYYFLENSIHRVRYDLGREKMLYALALKCDPNKADYYQKRIKIAKKYASKREIAYYDGEYDLPFLKNF